MSKPLKWSNVLLSNMDKMNWTFLKFISFVFYLLLLTYSFHMLLTYVTLMKAPEVSLSKTKTNNQPQRSGECCLYHAWEDHNNSSDTIAWQDTG